MPNAVLISTMLGLSLSVFLTGIRQFLLPIYGLAYSRDAMTILCGCVLGITQFRRTVLWSSLFISFWLLLVPALSIWIFKLAEVYHPANASKLAVLFLFLPPTTIMTSLLVSVVYIPEQPKGDNNRLAKRVRWPAVVGFVFGIIGGQIGVNVSPISGCFYFLLLAAVFAVVAAQEVSHKSFFSRKSFWVLAACTVFILLIGMVCATLLSLPTARCGHAWESPLAVDAPEPAGTRVGGLR